MSGQNKGSATTTVSVYGEKTSGDDTKRTTANRCLLLDVDGSKDQDSRILDYEEARKEACNTCLLGH